MACYPGQPRDEELLSGELGPGRFGGPAGGRGPGVWRYIMEREKKREGRGGKLGEIPSLGVLKRSAFLFRLHARATCRNCPTSLQKKGSRRKLLMSAVASGGFCTCSRCYHVCAAGYLLLGFSGSKESLPSCSGL